ncbi:hypothetical protein [Pacificibacter marinus]|uniref:hypothetical protein n=1 Tax=Pacificibacter marinus TaxID=658057 RepID=UPI001C06623E|nr:hypothetical protein [Pacificibacter marinus]MBU2866965.1 hypothetical protein [Pacificibacter marinus]
MKPNFALNFTHTGISLLHRASSGWHVMGDVSLEDPDMDAALSRLRSTATAMASSGLSTKLVIPNSQILYRTIPDPGRNESKRKKSIEDALTGATPYALHELVYDWNVTKDGLQIAVVARETLEEAESFARQHRFNPLCFVAIPEDGTFDAEPFFGRAAAADALIGTNTKIDRDPSAIHILALYGATQTAVLPEPDPTPVETVSATVDTDIGSEPEAPNAPQAETETASNGHANTSQGKNNAEGTAPAKDDPVSDVQHIPPQETVPIDTVDQTPDENETDQTTPEKIASANDVTAPPVQDANAHNVLPNDMADQAPASADDIIEATDVDKTDAQQTNDSDVNAPVETVIPPITANADDADETNSTAESATDSISSENDAPSPDTAPTTGFQSMRASFAATRSSTAPEPALMRLSAAPSRVLSAVIPPQEVSSPPLRVTDKSIPNDDGAPMAEVVDESLPQPRDSRTSGILRAQKSDDIKSNKSAPLPEPPAMPAPPSAQRRVDTLPPASTEQKLQIGAIKTPKPGPKTALSAKAQAPEATTSTIATLTPKATAVRAKLAQGGALALATLKARNAKKAAQAQAATEAKMALDSTPAPIEDLSDEIDTGPKPMSDKAAGLMAPKDASETKFNVFGARKTTPKPKRISLGIALTLGLLLFMALVAMWASWSTPDTAAPITETTQSENTSQIAPDVIPNMDETDLALESEAAIEIDTTDDDTVDLAFEPPLPSADDPVDIAEVTRQYVATGIWPLPPEAGASVFEDTTSDLYVASIDPNILSQDAVALPNAQPHQIDAQPLAAAGPAPAGTTYDFDPRGLVRATPEGAITPSGVMVYAGTPPIAPAARPGDSDVAALEAANTEGNTARAALAGFSPRLRPEGLVERSEQANLGGLTRTQLGAFRPKARPQSAQQTAQSDAEAEGDPAPAPTAPVVTASLLPEPRPQNIAKLAAAARAAEAAAQAATAAASGSASTTDNVSATRVTAAVPAPKIPSGPTATTVARAATVKNAINLRKVNLMGVYGSSSDRRALVRLPSGRLAKVKIGDRVDGGRVQSISDSALVYVKGNRSITLKIGA